MSSTTQLVDVLRGLLNGSMGPGLNYSERLAHAQRAFDELDRGLSFGAPTPEQWDRHKEEDRVDLEVEYWRGR